MLRISRISASAFKGDVCKLDKLERGDSIDFAYIFKNILEK